MAITLSKAGRNHCVYATAQIDATGTNSSDSIPVGDYTVGTIQVVWASITGTGSFKLQASNDGTNWNDISGATGSTSGAAGSTSFHQSSLPGLFIKLIITSAASAGTLDITATLKR